MQTTPPPGQVRQTATASCSRRTGQRLSESYVRHRIIEKAASIANEHLEELGTEPLPRLTPHSLRRTFATLLCALDRGIAFAKRQTGHETPSMLLDVYAGGVNPDEKKRPAALVRGEEWSAVGQSPVPTGVHEASAATA